MSKGTLTLCTEVVRVRLIKIVTGGLSDPLFSLSKLTS